MPAIRPWTPRPTPQQQAQQQGQSAEDPSEAASATATAGYAAGHDLQDTTSLGPSNKMSSDDDADIEMDGDERDDDDDDVQTIRGESSIPSDESPSEPSSRAGTSSETHASRERRKRAGGESDRDSAMEVEGELGSKDGKKAEKTSRSAKGKERGMDRLADDWYIPPKLRGLSYAVLIDELHKDGGKWWRRREGSDMTLVVPTPTAYKQAPRSSLPPQRQAPHQPALAPRQPPPQQTAWPYYPPPDRMNPYWHQPPAAYPGYPYWPPPHMYPPYGHLPPQRAPEWDYSREYPGNPSSSRGHPPYESPSPQDRSSRETPASRAYSPPSSRVPVPAQPENAPPRPPPPRPNPEAQSAFALRPDPQAQPPPSPQSAYALRPEYPYAGAWGPPYDYGRGGHPSDYWGYEAPQPQPQPPPPAPASTRRVSAPVAKKATPPADEFDDEDVIVYHVHKDYLLPQSATLLYHYAQISDDAPKDLENPLRDYPFRTHPPFPRHMPKSTSSHPVIRLHLPDPASFGQVLQYLYCGSQSYKMLDSALRQNHVTYGGLIRNAEWLGLPMEFKGWLGDWWQKTAIEGGKRVSDIGGLAISYKKPDKVEEDSGFEPSVTRRASESE